MILKMPAQNSPNNENYEARTFWLLLLLKIYIRILQCFLFIILSVDFLIFFSINFHGIDRVKRRARGPSNVPGK